MNSQQGFLAIDEWRQCAWSNVTLISEEKEPDGGHINAIKRNQKAA